MKTLLTREQTAALLENLGFIVHSEISVLDPTHSLDYLGTIIDTIPMS